MKNIKTPFIFSIQTQKQSSSLNSSQNYEKNEYKLDPLCLRLHLVQKSRSPSALPIRTVPSRLETCAH